MKEFKDMIMKEAKEEMLALQHPYVDSSHLMLALLRSSDFGGSRDFMMRHGISYELFYDTIIDVIGKGTVEDKNTPYTPALKQVLNAYTGMAKKRQSDDHSLIMLLALLQFYEGVGIRLLMNIGVDIDDLIEDLEELLDNSLDKLLKKYGCLTDLNKEVRENNTVVTGLDEQLQQLCKYLLKIQKPNVIVLGEPGVGKTALVEKLAVAINEKKVPKFLQDLRVVQLSLGSAVAGTKYRGEFEEKINGIIEAMTKKRNVILFIDEIHMMVGAGGAEGAIDASNLFKPVLARGKIRMIGATTNTEYKEFVCSDKAFARRFNTIEILETTEEETMAILSKAKVKLEKHYEIKLSHNDLVKVYKEATHRSGRMPDVALDALEEYCVDLYYNRESEKETEEVSV